MGYYRGDGNCYGRGDYYRGDYYKGDFLGIGKALRKVVGTVSGVVSGLGIPVVSGIAGAVHGIAAGGKLTVQPQPNAFSGTSMIPAFGPPTGMESQAPVGTMLRNEFIPGCQLKGTRPNKSGYYKQRTKGNPADVVYIPPKSVCVKTRRLNVANPRALRRAVRRAQGFAKMARRVMTFVSAKAPKGRAKFKRK